MSIEQKNVYIPGQNLTNLANNVDYNRIEKDMSNITVDFGTTPATVTVKAGTLIEVNGNLYAIEGDDEEFQMSDAGHNFIGFDGTTFDSYAAAGTYNPAKGGVYQAGDLIRTLKWFINQDAEEYGISVDLLCGQSGNLTEINSYHYEETTLGITLLTINATFQYSQTSDEIIIKKPCSCILNTNQNILTVAASISSYRYSAVQMYINSGWVNVFTTLGTRFIGSSSGDTGAMANHYVSLLPGKYRLKHFNESSVATTVYLYLIGVYGQNEIYSSSVYE